MWTTRNALTAPDRSRSRKTLLDPPAGPPIAAIRGGARLIWTIRYVAALGDPGQVLRNARLAAGLSQAELARRAGVTQSVISASGRTARRADGGSAVQARHADEAKPPQAEITKEGGIRPRRATV